MGRLSRLVAHICAIISPMARKYEMKRRAERMGETRRRIAEAAVELHRTVGPARTTVSAIAEKAGVQRHTYYAHFPELKDLYQACTAHHMERDLLPDTSLDPFLKENNVFLFRHWEAMRDTIADAFEASDERHEALLGAIALALDLQTWRTLVRQHGLDDDRAVELMVGTVRCLMRT